MVGCLACTTIGIVRVISAVATASLVDSCAADTAFFSSDVFACFDTGNEGLQYVRNNGLQFLWNNSSHGYFRVRIKTRFGA